MSDGSPSSGQPWRSDGFLILLNVQYGAIMSALFAFAFQANGTGILLSPNLNREFFLMGAYFLLDWWGVNSSVRAGICSRSPAPFLELCYIFWVMLLGATVLLMCSDTQYAISSFVLLATVASIFDIYVAVRLAAAPDSEKLYVRIYASLRGVVVGAAFLLLVLYYLLPGTESSWWRAFLFGVEFIFLATKLARTVLTIKYQYHWGGHALV